MTADSVLQPMKKRGLCVGDSSKANREALKEKPADRKCPRCHDHTGKRGVSMSGIRWECKSCCRRKSDTVQKPQFVKFPRPIDAKKPGEDEVCPRCSRHPPVTQGTSSRMCAGVSIEHASSVVSVTSRRQLHLQNLTIQIQGQLMVGVHDAREYQSRGLSLRYGIG